MEDVFIHHRQLSSLNKKKKTMKATQVEKALQDHPVFLVAELDGAWVGWPGPARAHVHLKPEYVWGGNLEVPAELLARMRIQ